MLKVDKIRLKPNKEQRIYFHKAFGIARFAYNWGLDEWKQMRIDGDNPSGYSLSKRLNSVKKIEFPWMYEVTKRAPQQALMNIETGYKNAFRRIKKRQPIGKKKNPWGFPVKKKKYKHDSFRATDGAAKGKDATEVIGKKLRLPKIGWIRMYTPMRYKGRIKDVTISRVADRYFAAILVDTDIITHRRRDNNKCGIDMGLKNIITLSNGEKREGAQPLAKLLDKQKRLDKELHRRKKGSNNRKKTGLKIAKLKAKIARIRSDSLHKLSSDIVLNNKFIAIEDLNINEMKIQEKWISRKFKHNVNRKLSDIALGELRRQLIYKSDWYDSNLVIIDKYFPSSKKCNNCGNIKEKLDLDERIYKCDMCNYMEDRDINAAKNILNEGLEQDVR